ncbi:glycosyltransferase family 2 protein [Fundidesulfovibrio soli]|uniref:glycosyltransferase family 2 protein n=1 Tax=Fundidesulfovibrio soli TaxID=2922716 RepID=UPI001FAEE089|nr:glycosyltransferase family 2 protein [Fundidesulfovibrio soli]
MNGKKVVVVMPAYNAAATLERTYAEVPKDIVDDVILVDDASRDNTIEHARNLGIKCFLHERNWGYGRNQKTCYSEALKLGADVVIMVHPDYQYTPLIIPAMANLVTSGLYDAVLASRILGGSALQGGMPVWKYVANRFLTASQNMLMGAKCSEYHTGYRAFSREVLEKLPLWENSDDFVFDNQMLAQTIYFGFKIGEVSCPTKYFKEASSINFRRSCIYGMGCLKTASQFRLQKMGKADYKIFDPCGRGLKDQDASYYSDQTREGCEGLYEAPRKIRKKPPDATRPGASAFWGSMGRTRGSAPHPARGMIPLDPATGCCSLWRTSPARVCAP